jgi:transaldolase
MATDYFHRVRSLTQTQFWINNPTRDEADKAIAAGATGCTLNPSYTQKMLDHPAESEYAYKVLDEVLAEITDDVHAIAEFQRRMAKPITDRFLPLFEKSGREMGYVSIQADPILEEDSQVIISEGRLNRAVAPNVCCKIPLTEPGLHAISVLLPEHTAINATEIFAMEQGEQLGELYERTIPKGANGPKLWYSHIAGIYDDYLYDYAKKHEVDIPLDYIAQAGLTVSKKMYAMVKERGYRMSFIGGGARKPHHFTELVGGDVNLTINWVGTADMLLEMDAPVVERIHHLAPQHVIDELCAKLPDFKKGYDEHGLHVEDFEEFGPVMLFRSSFMKSWNRVLDIIGSRR